MQVLHEADVDTKWERNMLMKATRKRERVVGRQQAEACTTAYLFNTLSFSLYPSINLCKMPEW